jgi:hypothetical protein
MLANTTPPHREATERLSFARQEGKFLVALGSILLALPFIVQCVGTVSWATAAWFVLFLVVVYGVERHQKAIRGRRTGAQWLAWLAIVVAGVVPLYAMLLVTTLGPDFAQPGASLLRAAIGTSLPVLMALLLGTDGLVSPSLRYRLYVLAGSLAVLAWTYLVVPDPWRYLMGNIGCCLVMIALGAFLLWHTASRQSASIRAAGASR